MKKPLLIGFSVLCLGLCVTPFAGMAITRTDAAIENKTVSSFPSLWENGALNTEMLEDMGSYFEEHFALRTQLVNADAAIQSSVFQVSNVDTVIKGTDGWLYYTATLDDYLGQATMTERTAFNAAHNLSLLQDYVTSQGAEFLLAIPPNKNSLYGDHMPYYYRGIVGDTKNLTLLSPLLEEFQIAATDLTALFQSQDEVLYWQRDSHWNEKGALLAYNAMLDTIDWDHDRYDTIEPEETETYLGDLNKMLFPMTATPELRYDYGLEQRYTYETETESVEDNWIETSCETGEGTALLFRDSFGNTLLPFFAANFAQCYFSKAQPYDAAAYLEDYMPDVVIVEKVERNLIDFATDAPIFEGPMVELEGDVTATSTDGTMVLDTASANSNFWSISGTVPSDGLENDSLVYVRVTTPGDTTTYEAFTVTDDNGDWGYQLYLSKDTLSTGTVEVEVITESGETLSSVAKASFQLSPLDDEETTGDGQKTVVSKQAVADCDGSGHGYYVITYSDGTVEYEDY